MSRNFAANLIRMGASKGDVLALILPNVPEFVFVFTGAPLAGVTVTTIPPSMTAHEMKVQLENSGAIWVVTNKERIDTVMQAVKEIDHSWRKDMALKGNWGEKIKIVLDANPDECPQGVMSISLMLANESEAPEVPDFDYNEDVMVIPYSSGTTGPPKGVELTHKYVKHKSSSLISTLLSQEHGKQHGADRLSRHGLLPAPGKGLPGDHGVCVASLSRLRHERDYEQHSQGRGQDGVPP